MAEDASYNYEVYVTERGTIQVSSPVKLSILHELQKGNLSLSELSKLVGKAQSTLSVHLDNMVEEGLITVHDDLTDCRKKYYTLVALQFAYSVPTSNEIRDAMYSKLVEVAKDPRAMHDNMAFLITAGLSSIGLNLSPILGTLGYIHGSALGGSLTGKDLKETIGNARQYVMGDSNTDDISLYSVNPLTIVIKGNMNVAKELALELTRYTVGFLSRVLEDATGVQYELKEFETFGDHDRFLRVILVPSQNHLSLKGYISKTE